jgi:CRP/FNR family transcriptional regulator, cyclic AMP receptor protein
MYSEILRGIAFLRPLSEEDLAAFGNLLIARECKSGERILEEGTPPDSFSIICDGVVHVRRRANSREMLMGRIGAGSFFGEINLFDPGVATASIVAMKRVQLAVISYADFRNFMEERPRAGYLIASGLMGELARRLRMTSARLVNAVFWSAKADDAVPA